ncbi:LuxR C-terminal-related transcriptional regulator, partial [Nonomuraea sp. ZG12]|uniref:LuxR C-terminal-related transcriptional regulator n=1 Tax=Nonomuraea sp. ZG12 TaxID=3452207 RepID=UPI003F89B19F
HPERRTQPHHDRDGPQDHHSPRRRLTAALTVQGLQVAQPAATGLSDEQKTDRPMLSHRTVGAHLYRAFPKLGVTSRAELQDALSAYES